MSSSPESRSYTVLRTPSLTTSPRSSPASSSSSFPDCPPFSEILPLRSGGSHGKKEQAFLFIDVQADHAENKSLRNQKQGFLLKNYHRKKKETSIRRLKAPSFVPANRLQIEGSDADQSTGSEDKDELVNTSQSSTQYPGQAAFRSEMWSLKAYLNQGFVDPFSSSAIQMSDSMNLYFHHFRIHTIAACYPLDGTRMSMWWWQRAIAQPALLQALLFLTAGHQATLESNNGISSRVIQKSIRDSLSLRGSTLKTLNNIMQDPARAVAESTTLVVASLVAIEAVDANLEALEAHQKGLRRLIHLLGGLDRLDHMTLSKIYQSAVKSAALQNSRPIFPISARWRAEILQDSRLFLTRDKLETPADLASLGSSFFESPYYPDLHSTMKTFLEVVHRLILYYEYALRHPSSILPTDNDLFLVCEHELLSAQYPLSKTDIHEPLRITLFIYLNLRVWHFQSFPFMQYMVEALQQSLLLPLSHLQSTTPELSFWILYIGSLASQGYKCHRWFVNGLIQITDQLGLNEWAKARAVLKGFFYTEQASERRAEEDLWNEVLSRASFDSDPYIAPKPTLELGIAVV